MTDERDPLYTCESCGTPIYAGDKYQPGGECNFCPEHAATLADILDFWERDVADGAEYPAWSDEFETIEAAREHVEDLRARIERDGDDHKPLYVA